MTTQVVSYSPPSLGGPGATATFDGVTFLGSANTGLPTTLASGLYQWSVNVMPLVGDSLTTDTEIGYDVSSKQRSSGDAQPFPASYSFSYSRDVSLDRPGCRRISLLGYYRRTSAPLADLWYRIDRAGKWWPGYKPAGTVLGSGTMTVLGATVSWEIKVSASPTTTIDDWQMPTLELHYAVTAGSIGAGAVVFDMLDDRGNWFQGASTNTTGVAGITGMAAPQAQPTPFGGAATRPGVSPVGFNPTHFSFRLSSDPLGSGTLVPTTPFLYLEPPGPALEDHGLEHRVKVCFDVSLDAITPGSVGVTDDTPGVSDPDGDGPVGVTPVPGGVVVTTPDGPVFVPLPGGTPNGPITIRIDDGTIFIIYDGDVIYVYTLSPEDWSRLNVSGTYVGVWDPETGTVTPGGTPIFPPLGGWRYRMLAVDEQPLGLRPRLFYAWASRRQGIAVGYWPATGAAELTEEYPQEWETADDVWVYRGGVEYEVSAAVATGVARAGGLAYLTEVPAPTP